MSDYDYDYDLFVIGAGSAGVRAARMAAGFGARVALCEDNRLGGTCVNVGCVPKKLFVYGSHFAEELQTAKSYGWSFENLSFDWAEMMSNKNIEIARLNEVYGRMLENAGVTIIHGRGVLESANAVRVGDDHYRAAKILLATGGLPSPAGFPGEEHAWTSNDIFRLTALPKRLLIVGGGFIGVEFGGILHNLGVEVVLINRSDGILRGFDNEVRQFLLEEMRKKGIEIRTNTQIRSAEKTEIGMLAHLDDGTDLKVDGILCACGRRPRIAGLGLETVGVETDSGGYVLVDDEYTTSVPSIFAMGDLVGRMQLTPVALAEGMAFARRNFGGMDHAAVDYNGIATAVFSQPNLATVGLTEEQARLDHDVVIFKSRFRPMKQTMGDGTELTFMKLVVDRISDRVLGCHMVGPDAGEVIQGLAVALKCGATKAQFDATIGIHPTAAEEFVTMRTPAE